MRRAQTLQLCLVLACACPLAAQEPASVAEVNRLLQTPGASRHVVFRGVVIHWANQPRGAYVQAERAGVFVRLQPGIALPALGDEVEVVASASFAGRGADTEIDAQSFRVTGHPGLPAPERCTLAESGTGKFNRLAVETEGAVLHASTHYGVPWLMLSDASGAAMVGIYSWPKEWKPETLVGKSIHLRGLSSGTWHMALRCSTPDEITVLDTPLAGAFAPLTSVEAVRGAAVARPVVLRGTCTFAAPKFFHLHDGRAEIVVNAPRFDPGGTIPRVDEEALISGVTIAEDGQPRIECWSVRTLGTGKLPSTPAATAHISAPRKTVRQVLDAPVSRERLAIAGVVTHVTQTATQTAFVVEDSTGPAWVYGPESVPGPMPPKQGDRVEADGVRTSTRVGAPQLYEASWRVTGGAAVPEARLITMADALSAAHDGRRVRLRGRAVAFETHIFRGSHVSRLWIRSGETATYGNFIGTEYAPEPAKAGQLVELEGICIATATGPGLVRTFAVQLDRMSDTRVLPEPPPWHDPTARRIILAISAVLAAVGAWVFVLRRQVRARTGELRAALAREQELGQLKTAFISMVSHEFRTPLNVIVTSSDILANYFDRLPVDERAEHLASIQTSVKRMAGMMEDVLLLGRLEAGRQKFAPQELHLAAWCRRFVDEMHSATAARCPIELRLGEFEPLVQADESILRHILANLVSNAVKYSEPGARVLLSVERDGGDAVFRVEDHGIGIPEADRSRLFESFQRGGNVAHIGGTGLGLVVVKRGVELHGGSVSFTSEEGQGTTFTVRLPLFENPK